MDSDCCVNFGYCVSPENCVRRYSWNQLRRTETDGIGGNGGVWNNNRESFARHGKSRMSKYFLSMPAQDNLKEILVKNYIQLPLNFPRTTLFPQSLGCSRSGRCMGLRSFFLCPNYCCTLTSHLMAANYIIYQIYKFFF